MAAPIPSHDATDPEGSDRRAVEAFLENPASHGLADGEAVERIDTHVATVFLAGERAWKVKRPVSYSFLDFSTLEARGAALRREIELNRRTAPTLYLEVLPIVREADGRLAFGSVETPQTEAVEWVLAMRRFDQNDRFDNLAAAGRLDRPLVEQLIDRILAFHEVAERKGRPFGGAAYLRRVIGENAEDFARLPETFPPERVQALGAAMSLAVDDVGSLLDARRAAGLVRQCHGDLHLANVVLWEGEPTLFDCIEFSDAIANIDLLYDLAFLLMDLEFRGFRPAASLALARYFGRSGQTASLRALPVMLSIRASVRAKVAAFGLAAQRSEEGRAAARRQALAYLEAAERHLQPVQPRLVLVGGLSGSGKSTLARTLAPSFEGPLGALHLRSDVMRKRIFGVAPEEHLPEQAYSRDVTRQVYELLLAEARMALVAGWPVVVDAVFARPGERRAAEAVAADLGLPLEALWLEAPGLTLKQRAAQRGRDASDATPSVVERQLSYDLGQVPWPRLQAEADRAAVAAEARRLLGLACPAGELA